MSLWRFTLAGSFSLLVTAALFLLMPILIKPSNKVLNQRELLQLADIVMPARDIDTQLKTNKPEKPDFPEEAPPELEQPNFDDLAIAPQALNLAPQSNFDFKLGLGVNFSNADGEFLPVVKVAPMYPRFASGRGVEGHCTVEYTVTKSGAVDDVKVLDCTPPGYFERVSVKAANKFKYKPRVIDGEAVDVVGVRNRFTFELER
jgi:protein TonB